ncbi:hypothetical protein ABZ419_26705 [Streptomyces cinnamoneus]|uniref:hypothetical protein n=1 Tax=Streptomyces cinnamoneus TaxID=53446 RepID=UPI003400C27F
MDLHALAQAGSLLHRADGAPEGAHARWAAENHAEEPTTVTATLCETQHLVGQARDHTLVAYALGQLRIGPPRARPGRVRDAFQALARAAREIEYIVDALLDSAGDVRGLGQASQDMSGAVMLLAPFLSPKMTAGVDGDTPVRLATRLRVVAEAANIVLPATPVGRSPA